MDPTPDVPAGAGRDEPYLRALRAQDGRAFARLVAEHQPVVAGLCQSLGLRGPDADDAAAEAFAHVYRSLPRFEGRSALGTWVYQIAIRTLRRHRAKRGRLDRREATTDAPPDAVDDRAPTPERASINRESAERLWSAVAALEPRSAMAVELYYRRGWPLEQIAEALNCPVGTIKTLLFRAREALRQTLKSEDVTT